MNIINIEERNAVLRALLSDALTMSRTLAHACEQDMEKQRHREAVRSCFDELRVAVADVTDFLAEQSVDNWEDEA